MCHYPMHLSKVCLRLWVFVSLQKVVRTLGQPPISPIPLTNTAKHLLCARGVHNGGQEEDRVTLIPHVFLLQNS